MPPFCGSLKKLLSSPQNGGTPWQERAASAVRAPAARAGSNHVLVPQWKVTKVRLEGPYKQGQSQPLPKQALRVALRNGHKKDCAQQHIWVLFNWVPGNSRVQESRGLFFFRCFKQLWRAGRKTQELPSTWGDPSLRWGKIPGLESFIFADISLHT